MSLRGEYWISPDGQEIFADSDSDIEVLSHEMVAMRHFIKEIEEELIETVLAYQEEFIEDCGEDFFKKLAKADEDERWAYILNYEPCLIKVLSKLWGAEKAKDIRKDARMAFEKYENQIRVKYFGYQANYEAYDWNTRKLLAAKEHLMEQLEGLSPDDKKYDMDRIEVFVEDTKTGRFNNFSLEDFLKLKNTGRMWVKQNPIRNSVSNPKLKQKFVYRIQKSDGKGPYRSGDYDKSCH